MKRTLTVTSVLLVLSLLIGLVGCTPAEVQRNKAIDQRAQMFARAEAKYPVPQNSNFPLRQSLVKYTERGDLTNHLYYVYVLADTGNIIGYYVAQGQPVSINAFLSSTEDATDNGVLTAPSLDGIFYGGAGASADANGWFFFDAATDALVILYGVKLFVADQPLKVDAKAITVEPVSK